MMAEEIEKYVPGTRIKDLSGMHFGEWEVKKYLGKHEKSQHPQWLCRCSCGTERPVDGYSFKRSRSCGCKPSRKKESPKKYLPGTRIEDLRGERYGEWEVLEFAGKDKDGCSMWVCRCSCGEERPVRSYALTHDLSTSCGNLQKHNIRGNGFDDLIGQKFGRLKVIEYVNDEQGEGQSKTFWKCECECGNIAERVEASNLKTGNTTSCGCVQDENRTKHGLSDTRVYRIWKNMIQRCENANHNNYGHYGERGISVCDEWHDFESFYADMGEPPSDKHELDRQDVNGDYCKENCKWVTRKEQMRNTRNTIYLEYKGEKRPMAEWAELLGMNYDTLQGRIFDSGWSVEKAFEEPVGPSHEPRTFCIQGETLTIAEIAEKFDVNKQWLIQQADRGRDIAWILRDKIAT